TIKTFYSVRSTIFVEKKARRKFTTPLGVEPLSSFSAIFGLNSDGVRTFSFRHCYKYLSPNGLLLYKYIKNINSEGFKPCAAIKNDVKILIFLLLTTSLTAQTHSLKILPTDTDTTNLNQILTDYDYPKQFTNTLEAKKILPNILSQLQNRGYIAASFDSLQSDSLRTLAYLYLGNKYHWLQLKNGNVEAKGLAQIGFRERLFSNSQNVQIEGIKVLKEKLLQYAENNGYPFAAVQLQNVNIGENGGVSAELWIEKNDLVVIDSILTTSNVSISERYLQNYLGIKSGQPYDESALQKTSIRINELPFLEEVYAPRVTFVRDKAKVRLFLKNKKASQLNLLLGVIPRSAPQTGFEVTGEGKINLQNTLGQGEVIEADFRSYPNSATELKLHALYPYLPLLPLGIDGRFELFRKDTLFQDVKSFLAVQYLFEGNNYLKAFLENTSSNLLSVNESQIINRQELPNTLDVRRNLYGLEYNWEQLDYRLNPRKGTFLNLKGAIGNKRVKENNAILEIAETQPNLDFKAQYDALNENPVRYRLQYEIGKYWKLGDRVTFKNSLAGGIQSKRDTLQNELFRIGGNKLLRGFDEQSILSVAYHVLSLELRLLTSQNAYLFTFWDGALTQNETAVTDIPFGFGGGVTFQTKAGVFGLTYALGREQGNRVNLRAGKVHFGYVNYF
ncbi:MAG: BamA/TamA family outer membrane protein, partial [Chitinophagales bacterium]